MGYKIKDKDFIKACKGSMGIRLNVAKALKVERASITLYLQSNPHMEKYLDEDREASIDVAENQLLVQAGNGQKWAVDRLLKSKGRDRGYGDHQEIQVNANASDIVSELAEAYNDFSKGSNTKTKRVSKKG